MALVKLIFARPLAPAPATARRAAAPPEAVRAYAPPPPAARPVPPAPRKAAGGVTDDGRVGRRQRVRLVVSWLVVSALLVYGVVQTLITAAKLFTG
nr:hypothetical protein [Micromonospora auratinigra]